MQSILPDKRFRATCQSIMFLIMLYKITVIRQIAKDRNERDRIYRFLAHAAVTVKYLITDVLNSFETTALPLQNHLLLLGDSCEVSTAKQSGRRGGESDIGVISDNKTPGFLLHVNMAVEATSGLPLMITHIQSWQRAQATQSKKERKGKKSLSKPVANDPTGEARESESKKWEIGVKGSMEVLQGAKHVTCIHDREDDDYSSLYAITGMGVSYIVRARNNRLLYVEPDKQDAQSSPQEAPPKQYLFDAVGKTECKGSYTFNVQADKRKNRQQRKAVMEVRYMQANINRPSDIYAPYPPYLTLWVIEAKEKAESVPPGEDPIHWLLITDIAVLDLEIALTIIKWYTWRWLIEQLFRILKAAGLDIENCGLNSIEEIQKLCILALPTALNVLQLTYSEQSEQMQITNVFNPEKVALLEHLNADLQGNTAKQKNPYPKQSIAWAKWVIARLGGWDPAETRPAGVITIFNGMKRFNEMYLGWALALATVSAKHIDSS